MLLLRLLRELFRHECTGLIVLVVIAKSRFFAAAHCTHNSRMMMTFGAKMSICAHRLYIFVFCLICFTHSKSDSTCSDDYMTYLIQHGKPLERASDQRRKDAFCDSVAFITSHSSNSMKLQTNDMSDWLEQEISQMFTKIPESDKKVFRNLDMIKPVPMRKPSKPVVTSIDWSTTANAFGYSIIPSVQNQGMCGACWAFASASSVNAALKITLHQENPPPKKKPVHASNHTSTPTRSPTMTATSLPTGSSNNSTSSSTVVMEASGAAAAAEIVNEEAINAATAVPPLSAQELIDCDRTFNTGCSGGSPWYALQYISINGVVSSKNYPFTQKQATCRSMSSMDSRYYIRQYSAIVPSDENALLTALSAGPVIVGICGTDLSFLYYSSGIYNADDCCVEQNHAMLLVGFGHDNVTGLNYWKAQNSWGTRWGEKGYMRILRLSGSQDAYSGGTCGLALTPVVGSGGYIVGNSTVLQDRHSLLDRYLLIPVSETVLWVEAHWRITALVLGSVALVLGMMFLVSGLYLDHLLHCHSRARAARQGYTSVPDAVAAAGVSSDGGMLRSQVVRGQSGSARSLGNGERTHFEIQV